MNNENYGQQMKHRGDVERMKAASEGIKTALQHERPIKIHLTILTIGCLILRFLFGEWWLIKQTIILGSLIIAAEMINTTIEELADLIQPARDPRIKKIKDYAAGVTFLFVVIGAALTIADIILLLIK